MPAGVRPRTTGPSAHGYPESTVAELKTEQILALLAPIVVIQIGLMVAALHDLEQEDRHVRGGSKLVWALVIVFVNVIGPIVYLVAGRDDA
jgi:Phospholipase_D-nuclease N-terminal